MNQMNFPVLSIITFLPLVGALVVALAPRTNEKPIKTLALLASADRLRRLVAAVCLLSRSARQPCSSANRVAWMPELGISYQLGVDGISLWLVLLTTFLTPLAILSSWTAVKRPAQGVHDRHAAAGDRHDRRVLATDLFLFYVFWEAMLIPMYFLIGVVGRAAPHLRRHQVCAVHHGRQRADAGCHSERGLPESAVSWPADV